MRLETTIRRAARPDAECLAALSIQVWLDTYATDGIRPAIAEHVLSEFTAERFISVLDDPGWQLLVAEINNHLVGYSLVKFGSVCPTDATLHSELVTLYVQERFTHTGLGSALLARSRSLSFEKMGNTKVWLTVWIRNQRATSFYQKHGFLQAGTTEIEFSGERHTNIVFIATDA